MKRTGARKEQNVHVVTVGDVLVKVVQYFINSTTSPTGKKVRSACAWAGVRVPRAVGLKTHTLELK